MIEAKILSLIGGYISCYPDVAPAGTDPPFCVYSRVGGERIPFFGGKAADKKRVDMSFAVWHVGREQSLFLAQKMVTDFEKLEISINNSSGFYYLEVDLDMPDMRGIGVNITFWDKD